MTAKAALAFPRFSVRDVLTSRASDVGDGRPAKSLAVANVMPHPVSQVDVNVHGLRLLTSPNDLMDTLRREPRGTTDISQRLTGSACHQDRLSQPVLSLGRLLCGTSHTLQVRLRHAGWLRRRHSLILRRSHDRTAHFTSLCSRPSRSFRIRAIRCNTSRSLLRTLRSTRETVPVARFLSTSSIHALKQTREPVSRPLEVKP